MHTLLTLVAVPLLLAASTPFVTDTSTLRRVLRPPTQTSSVSSRRRTLVTERRSRRLQRRDVLSRQSPTRVVPAPSPLPSPLPSPKRFPNQFYVPTYPLPSLNATSHVLVLGERAPVIALIKVTPLDEPVHVRTVTITLVTEVSSVSTLEVFDEVGFLLGTAALDIAASSARDVFTLDLAPDKAYFIERRDTVVLALRPIVKEKDVGGVSGQTVQVEAMTVSATGEWTNKTNLVSTSGPDFQKHQTSNAILTSVSRSGPAEGTFATGNQRTLGAFTLEARKNSKGTPALSSLSFSVSTPAEVTLSVIKLRGNDSAMNHACSLVNAVITCASIPAEIGSLDTPRTLTLVADVSITSHPNPFLQVTLNTPGRPGSAGDVTWTDGDATFTWVPFDYPIAEGTLWE